MARSYREHDFKAHGNVEYFSCPWGRILMHGMCIDRQVLHFKAPEPAKIKASANISDKITIPLLFTFRGTKSNISETYRPTKSCGIVISILIISTQSSLSTTRNRDGGAGNTMIRV